MPTTPTQSKTKPLSERDYEGLLDRLAILRETLMQQNSSMLIQNPQLAELFNGRVDEMLDIVEQAEAKKPPVPDGGLSSLIGLGPDAASDLGAARAAPSVTPYDELVTPERINALGDLYYIYQHEMIGVFRVTLKLQELFKAGVVRLSSGPGAFRLYQYDRREVLRYTSREGQQAYVRAFGYTNLPASPSAMANRPFHGLFSNFVAEVARFFRDKRISEVIRERATDPSFGSIAIVRRAGLDLRYNAKNFSYGHLNVLRVEVMQLLEDAFKILESDDVKKLFGAENAWEVIEDVLRRYFREYVNVSPRNRMAIAGRDILRWLAQPYILNSARAQFEALLQQIAEPSEEWLTSAQTLGVAARAPNGASSAGVGVAREAVVG
jgi:hypothetical protein